MPQQLNQVPPGMQVWLVGGVYFLVRMNERVQPPVPMVWEVSAGDVEALGIKRADRKFSNWNDFYATGGLRFGNSRELLNTTEDPLEQIYSNYAQEVRVKPWLADPEILSLWMGAALEGRSITDAELQGTEWWRTHTAGERQWLSLNASDPATAQSMIVDNRTRVADMFRAAGIDNAPPDLVQKVADQMTMGIWTEVYALNQIRLLADPRLPGALDPLLKGSRTGLDQTLEGEDQVRAMIEEWLGPAYGNTWKEGHIKTWASKLREDPDALIELEKVLRQHRLALYPEYDNPSLTYEDIAAPWRGVFNQIWGELPDETSSTFNKVVRMNDMHQAEAFLRTEGLKQGNNTVSQSLLSDMNNALGGQIRRADPAVG